MSWSKSIDSQGFALPLVQFPELVERGDCIIRSSMGINILMTPEDIACSQALPWSTFASEPPAGQLRLASPTAANFTMNLFTAAAQVLPSKYFSTGGVELKMVCYAEDARTQADLQKCNQMLEQALNSFTVATHGALTKLGKIPVDTLVMVWISSQHTASVAAKNFKIVPSSSDYFYLDCGAGQWMGGDPLRNSWCDPFKTWQKERALVSSLKIWNLIEDKSYTFDPLAELTSDQAHLVLGRQQLYFAPV
ncbi:glycoside hydrolase superfamily [Mycena epipterygia]|nr:glycoside hydrolase superfamily [Mycena epipterygia]